MPRWCPVGSTVVFTYLISNPGNIGLSVCRPEIAPCTTQQGILRDDNGTPSNSADDFSPTYVAGDVNGNNILDPGEVWLFAASGMAVGGGAFQSNAASTAAAVAAIRAGKAPSGTGANQPGPYDPFGTGLPSGNGQGKGNAYGKPAAGTVGNADTKNPPGQVVKFAASPDNGYECDGNSGIAHGNPAHSTCTGKVIYINTATALGTVTLTDNSVLSVLAQDKAAYLTATPVVASVSGTSVNEGNTGTTTATVTITLQSAPQTTVDVWYQTVDGTAHAGSDYVAASDFVTFAPGELSKTVALSVIGDTVIEPNETFQVVLTAAIGAAIGTGTATVTILNDDSPPTIALAGTDLSGAEQGQDPIVFTITRGANLVGQLSVALTWAGGATYGTDYTVSASNGATLSAGGSTLVVPDGVGTVVLTVTPIDDTAIENAETVMLTVGSSSAYTVSGGASQTGTIADNDKATVNVASVSATRGQHAARRRVSVGLTLSAPAPYAITVAYQTADGTATAGSDYTAASGSVTFAAGRGEQDDLRHACSATSCTRRTRPSTSTSPTRAEQLPAPTARVTILNDDAQPTISLAGTDLAGAEQLQDPIVFTITRGANLNGALSVALTWGGTATYGTDYTVTASNGATLSAGGSTLVVPTGVGTVVLTVKPVDDTAVENAETVVLTLGSSSAYAINGGASQTGTIVDNDKATVERREPLAVRGQRRLDGIQRGRDAVGPGRVRDYGRVPDDRRDGDRRLRLHGGVRHRHLRARRGKQDDLRHRARRHAERAERDVQRQHHQPGWGDRWHQRHGHDRERRLAADDCARRHGSGRGRAGPGSDRVHDHARRQPVRAAERGAHLGRRRDVRHRLHGVGEQRRHAVCRRFDARGPGWGGNGCADGHAG